MSIVLPPRTEVTWAKVEDGFYVGSSGGEFRGYIDEDPSGLFVASNMFSRVIGEFAALSDAMRAVDTAHEQSGVHGEVN
ncbi:hypothetical protein [Leucobacter sp. USHLN153]|uniref:hypothetical protein n=1 Tax=Leucobacter sp. USHLN153 TaxID=3081268 RepID=UPI00301B25C7